MKIQSKTDAIATLGDDLIFSSDNRDYADFLNQCVDMIRWDGKFPHAEHPDPKSELLEQLKAYTPFEEVVDK